MDPASVLNRKVSHVVAMPYPGRGHINPMLNLCKLMASKTHNLHITFVVTEEWLGLMGSENKPANLSFATIPNVIPSELVRGADIPGFMKATQTKMEEPFERLLDRLDPPVNIIIADTFLLWPVKVGSQRNIPVALLWPSAASVFSMFYHFDLIVQNQHFPIIDLSEKGDEVVDYIPGLSTMRVADLPASFFRNGRGFLPLAVEPVALVKNAQYLLFTSIIELEAKAIDALKQKFEFPIYVTGSAIPYFNLKDSIPNSTINNGPDCYLEWLDSQSPSSVLYVSLGSYLSVKSAQMDEIAAGLGESGVRYLWAAREETSRLREGCGDARGLVVPWCDQLRVLCHPSVGGFWTHCGWNSTMEGVFAGVPLLTFPIGMDQIPNSKLIVEDWKIGWKVEEEAGTGTSNLVKRKEIARLVQRLMDLEGADRKEMVARARELREICHRAIAKGGSSETDLDAFVRKITQSIN